MCRSSIGIDSTSWPLGVRIESCLQTTPPLESIEVVRKALRRAAHNTVAILQDMSRNDMVCSHPLELNPSGVFDEPWYPTVQITRLSMGDHGLDGRIDVGGSTRGWRLRTLMAPSLLAGPDSRLRVALITT
jgi:hypothetical protein